MTALICLAVSGTRASAGNPPGVDGSGGQAVAYHPGGSVITDPVITGQAPSARFYRTGFDGYEPTLGVDSSGAVFADAVTRTTSVASGSTVIASMNQGQTWNNTNVTLPAANLTTHSETTDPYFYLDPTTNRIFLSDLKPPGQALSYSVDQGKTYTNTVAGLSLGDHQTIFAGPPPTGGTPPVGYPNVVYDCAIATGLSVAAVTTSCEKSLDGGLTWARTGPSPAADAYASGENSDPGDFGVPGNCEASTGHGYVGPDGTLYLGRGWCGQPWIAFSHDEGATWTRVKVATNGMAKGWDGLISHEAGVAADKFGNVYYTWVDHDRLPFLAVSRDGGKSWGSPLMIGPPGIKETNLPGIELSSSGRVVMVYNGSTNSPGAPFPGGEGPHFPPQAGDCVPFVTCAPPTAQYTNVTFNGYLTMTVDALDPNPVLYTASVNDPAHPLLKGVCGPDPERCQVGDFVDDAIGPDGTPWGVFVDACSNAAAVKGGSCTFPGEAVIGRLVGGPSLLESTPPTSIAEAPLSVLLIPLAVVGAAVVGRRRRRQR
ncbi:MAG: exo-alpha-sialidase [Candidatus Dormibacteraeota bacterium]|uniref:Exo-alpha-sialidase n=1 Tax=Candidatus Amunia macphersoniae TaxID=3127014 RepID=A0A934N8V3_9BACT|nr:exo-alpha-sialidase [Candidatus Dormibacteraeota bacterium]